MTAISQRSAYQRHLPHWIPSGKAIFLTWNLKGALPQHAREAIQTERRRLEKEPIKKGESQNARQLRHDRILFVIADRYLDGASQGPMHLKDCRASKIVVDSILFGIPERHDLFAFAVMQNHVHVLLLPHLPLEKITQGIKGFSAHAINLLRSQRGHALWLDESFDHWVRTPDELLRIIAYIERNPVKAGLCAEPEQWVWSSAFWRDRYCWEPGDLFRAEWKGSVTAAQPT